MAQVEKRLLRVEGKNDMHVIRNLLQRHGIDGSIVEISDSGAEHHGAGGVDSLLAGMGVAVKASNAGLASQPRFTVWCGDHRKVLSSRKRG